MVIVKNSRLKKNEPLIDQGSHKMEAHKALSSIIETEFMYGCKVNELTEEKIALETNVFNCCTDFTEVAGSKEEMKDITIFTVLYVKAMSNDKLFDTVIAKMEKALGKDAGNPFFFTSTVCLFTGNTVCKNILMAVSGFTEEEIKAVKDMKTSDVLALYELKNESKMSVSELLTKL